MNIENLPNGTPNVPPGGWEEFIDDALGDITAKPPLEFLYTNHKGVTAVRHAIPVKVRWGSTSYHPEEQWLLDAYDTDKMAPRTFALKDMVLASAHIPEVDLSVQGKVDGWHARYKGHRTSHVMRLKVNDTSVLVQQGSTMMWNPWPSPNPDLDSSCEAPEPKPKEMPPHCPLCSRLMMYVADWPGDRGPRPWVCRNPACRGRRCQRCEKVLAPEEKCPVCYPEPEPEPPPKCIAVGCEAAMVLRGNIWWCPKDPQFHFGIPAVRARCPKCGKPMGLIRDINGPFWLCNGPGGCDGRLELAKEDLPPANEKPPACPWHDGEPPEPPTVIRVPNSGEDYLLLFHPNWWAVIDDPKLQPGDKIRFVNALSEKTLANAVVQEVLPPGKGEEYGSNFLGWYKIVYRTYCPYPTDAT